jgi:hypothetical protein
MILSHTVEGERVSWVVASVSERTPTVRAPARKPLTQPSNPAIVAGRSLDW